MEEHALQVLEFPPIRKILVSLAETAGAQEGLARLAPAAEPEQAKSELALTGLAVEWLRERGRPPLYGCLPDADLLSRLAISGAAMEPEEALALRDHLRHWQGLESALTSPRGGSPALHAHLKGAEEALPDLRDLLAAYERIFDAHGGIRDDASPALLEARRSRETLHGRLAGKVEGLVERYKDHLRDQPATQRMGRYVLPVRSDRSGGVNGILLDRSNTGGTLFIEPLELIELNNELVTADEREAEALRAILRDLASRAHACIQDLRDTLAAMVEADRLLAKAQLAKLWDGSCPLLGGDRVVLRDARHPLLDERLRSVRESVGLPGGPAHPVVPVNLELTAREKVLIISGPNAGGKTVSLKTLGLLSLCAQSGLFVPAASGTEFPVFGSVAAVIGDEQSIGESLSTFSARLKHLGAALHDVQAPALVLLDELGSGTDPEEGSALGAAVLLEFLKRGVHVVASTHSEPLKALAERERGMRNASVGFEQGTWAPTYRLEMDRVQPSMALSLAKRAGFPEAVLTAAEGFLSRERRRLQELAERLEEERSAAVAERAAAEKARREAAEERERLRAEGARLEETRAGLKAKVEKRFEREVRAFLDAIEDAKLRAAIARDTRKAQREHADAVLEDVAPPAAPVLAPSTGGMARRRLLQPGDHVIARSTGARGVIKASDAKHGGWLVQMGSAVWPVPDSDLDLEEVAASAPVRKKSGKLLAGDDVPAGRGHSEPAPEVVHEILLLGMRVDDAEDAVKKALDTAGRTGQSQLRVVHGIGTGALRKAVRALLKKEPSVERFEEAPPHQGGSGATVVYLKT